MTQRAVSQNRVGRPDGLGLGDSSEKQREVINFWKDWEQSSNSTGIACCKPGFNPQNSIPGVEEASTCNPSTEEVKAGESEVQSHPLLHKELGDGLE